jgi:hypothetical protein
MIMFRELVEYKNKHNGSTHTCVSQQYTTTSDLVNNDCAAADLSSESLTLTSLYHKLGDWFKTQRQRRIIRTMNHHPT